MSRQQLKIPLRSSWKSLCFDRGQTNKYGALQRPQLSLAGRTKSKQHPVPVVVYADLRSVICPHYRVNGPDLFKSGIYERQKSGSIGSEEFAITTSIC